MGVVVSALALASPALAVPPALSAVGGQHRAPTATFSAPRAGSLTVYLASKPDRGTDGNFLPDDLRGTTALTKPEIQAGKWVGPERVDPGTYYVMLRANPDFDSCYEPDLGDFEAGCADGFSNIMTLVVEKPVVTYSARVTTSGSRRKAFLRLTATPLGEQIPYRVCFRLKNRKPRCLAGALRGSSWDKPAQSVQTAATQQLSRLTTFTWYVGARKVATKRVRVR